MAPTVRIPCPCLRESWNRVSQDISSRDITWIGRSHDSFDQHFKWCSKKPKERRFNPFQVMFPPQIHPNSSKFIPFSPAKWKLFMSQNHELFFDSHIFRTWKNPWLPGGPRHGRRIPGCGIWRGRHGEFGAGGDRGDGQIWWWNPEIDGISIWKNPEKSHDFLDGFLTPLNLNWWLRFQTTIHLRKQDVKLDEFPSHGLIWCYGWGSIFRPKSDWWDSYSTSISCYLHGIFWYGISNGTYINYDLVVSKENHGRFCWDLCRRFDGYVMLCWIIFVKVENCDCSDPPVLSNMATWEISK